MACVCESGVSGEFVPFDGGGVVALVKVFDCVIELR